MTTRDERVQIAVDTERINGTFVTPGNRIPGVLFVHGWGGSQAQYLARAREVAALGCVCLAFDLRGHGEALTQFQTVSREMNLRDVVAAYDQLADRPEVDRESIAVVGSSYGGYLSAILTTMRPVKWLGLRAPALYRDTLWEAAKLQLHKEQDLRAYRSQPVAAEENRALQACQEFRGDILLIESELDTIVPNAVLASYRKAAKEARSLTYRVIEGADHGLTQERDQLAYTLLLLKWLKEMIFSARKSPIVTPERDTTTPPEAPPEVHRATASSVAS
jgi:pimeloyl-ACP methyl ester carboxylesterase